MSSKIIVNSDCSHKIKTLAAWKKNYNQPGNYVKKQRHYFANKGPSSQIYGFSSSHVCMWELGTIKKVECWRIKAFELWCWRSLLRVPWTARRSNQSILKKWVFVARTDCWTWSSNTLVTWCKELTHQKRPWSRERLKATEEVDRLS